MPVRPSVEKVNEIFRERLFSILSEGEGFGLPVFHMGQKPVTYLLSFSDGYFHPCLARANL